MKNLFFLFLLKDFLDNIQTIQKLTMKRLQLQIYCVGIVHSNLKLYLYVEHENPGFIYLDF